MGALVETFHNITATLPTLPAPLAGALYRRYSRYYIIITVKLGILF